MKKILSGDEARRKIAQGIKEVARIAGATLGPKGRNVAIKKDFGEVIIVNDGVTIVREITLNDPFEDMGATLMKDVAEKTNKHSGDGTTTSVILASAMVQEGLRNLSMGVNAVQIKAGIQKAVKQINTELGFMKTDVSSKEMISQVATVSAQDYEVGKLIADVFEEIGNDGVITVEESPSTGVSKEIVKGMQFDMGYISPYMVTDTARMEAAYEDIPVLVTDYKLSSAADIMPVMEKVLKSGQKKLLIIAEDIDSEALGALVVNKIRGSFFALAIKAPFYGDRKKDALKDISIATGAKFISSEIGAKIEDFDPSWLGKVKKVVSDKDKSLLIGGEGKAEERVKELKEHLKNTRSDFEKEKLTDRIAKLSGGVGVIKVGAATEAELKEKKLRIEDAVSATKAAIEEGIVPGGGAALYVISQTLDFSHLSSDEKVGADIVIRALSYPLRKIIENAGRDPGAIIERMKNGLGYNAETDEMVDLVRDGVIDPKKVTRLALENAASAAGIFLTMEAAIVHVEKEEKGVVPLPS